MKRKHDAQPRTLPRGPRGRTEFAATIPSTKKLATTLTTREAAAVACVVPLPFAGIGCCAAAPAPVCEVAVEFDELGSCSRRLLGALEMWVADAAESAAWRVRAATSSDSALSDPPAGTEGIAPSADVPADCSPVGCLYPCTLARELLPSVTFQCTREEQQLTQGSQ